MEYIYRFPAVKGRQAGREYYIGMVPLKMLRRLFPSEEEYVLPEFRAQRRVNETRIPVISKYIIENRNDYVFSALSASIDGDFQFVPVAPGMDLGFLEVAIDAVFLINDGQHRKAAILEALEQDPTLGDETISVVFFEDRGLERSQQIFTDLNKHAVKTSNSIAELYDSRDSLAVMTRKMVSSIPFLDTYTDKERDILGKYSSNLFTLNNFYSANKRILVKIDASLQTTDFLVRYWKAVVENITEWNELQNKEISKKDLRENYIVTQSVILQALGRVGNYFIQHPELDLEGTMKGLKKIDWQRSSPHWKMRTIRADGRIITNDLAILLTANLLKKALHIPLSEEEIKKENRLQL